MKAQNTTFDRTTKVIEEEKTAHVKHSKTRFGDHTGHDDQKTEGGNSEMGHKDGDEITSEGGSIAGNTDRKVKKAKKNI